MGNTLPALTLVNTSLEPPPLVYVPGLPVVCVPTLNYITEHLQVELGCVIGVSVQLQLHNTHILYGRN